MPDFTGLGLRVRIYKRGDYSGDEWHGKRFGGMKIIKRLGYEEGAKSVAPAVLGCKTTAERKAGPLLLPCGAARQKWEGQSIAPATEEHSRHF